MRWWYLQWDINKWNVKQWCMYKVNFKILAPSPNLFLWFPKWFSCVFSCGTLARPGWRRSCHKGSTPTSPQVYFSHMGTDSCPWGWWALFAAFNPALIHLFCAPHLNSKEIAYGLVCLPLELEWQLERQTPWPGLQDLKLQVLWTLERAVGKWRNWELSEIFLKEVGRGEGGSMMWLPSRVHRYLLPLIPLLPPSFSPTPPSLAAAPLPQASVLLPFSG